LAKLTLQEVGAGYSASTDLNANNALLEAALENTLSRDGTTPNEMLAVIDMNDNRIINLADGVSPQDAATFGQMVAFVSGASGVISVGEGFGIEVDASIPTIPVVGLTTGVQDSLALADSAVQVADLGAVAFSNDYNDLDNLPSGTPSDHGSLTGLGDDDHPQYAEIANTETITGVWTHGAALKVADTFSVIVGHTTGVLTNGLEVLGTSTTDAAIGIACFSASTTGGELEFGKSRNASLGGNTIVQAGDTLGLISAYGADGTNYDLAAQIKFLVGATPSAGTDMPGIISFLTSLNATATPVERLKLDENGDIYTMHASAADITWIGYNSTLATAGLKVELGTASTYALVSLPATSVPTMLATASTVVGANNNVTANTPVLRWAGASAGSFTGIIPAANGQVLRILNMHASSILTLNHEDTNSTSTNRFTLPGAANYAIDPLECITLWYDATSTRWVIIAERD